MHIRCTRCARVGIVIIAATQYIRVFHVDIIYHITTVNCSGVWLQWSPQDTPIRASISFTTILQSLCICHNCLSMDGGITELNSVCPVLLSWLMRRATYTTIKPNSQRRNVTEKITLLIPRIIPFPVWYLFNQSCPLVNFPNQREKRKILEKF